MCLRRAGPYLNLKVPGLTEGRPSLLVGDRAILCEEGRQPFCFSSKAVINIFPINFVRVRSSYCPILTLSFQYTYIY